MNSMTTTETNVTETKTETRIHPWEKAGLGKAPFRWMGVSEDIGPHRFVNSDGFEVLVGAPGQPMGCCAYCGQGIAECHHIRSADGKDFIVGCDCVEKVEHKGTPVYTAAERAHRDRTNKAARIRRDRKDDMVAAEINSLLADADILERLSSVPSVHAWQAEQGASRLDDYFWLATRCGAQGRAKMLRNLKKEMVA